MVRVDHARGQLIGGRHRHVRSGITRLGTVIQVTDDPPVPPFDGFPSAATELYQQLTVTNSREFWASHRDIYEQAVRGPMLALTSELSAEFGDFKVFRPNRDVRFSADKSPYKTSQGAVTEGEGGEFYYLQINADGLM